MPVLRDQVPDLPAQSWRSLRATAPWDDHQLAQPMGGARWFGAHQSLPHCETSCSSFWSKVSEPDNQLWMELLDGAGERWPSVAVAHVGKDHRVLEPCDTLVVRPAELPPPRSSSVDRQPLHDILLRGFEMAGRA